MNKNNKWTIEELHYLHDSVQTGASWDSISSALNRSIDSVQCKHRQFNWSLFLDEDGCFDAENDSSLKNKSWTEEELQILYTNRIKGISYKQISDELDRSWSAVRSKFDSTDWESLGYVNSPETRERDRKLKAFKNHSKNLAEHRTDRLRMRTDALCDTVKDIARTLPEVPPPEYNKNEKKKHSPEDMGLILSDCHYGHSHTLEETGGISQCTTEDLIRRTRNLREAVPKIYELHSSLYDIPCLHIFGLGDVVQGMNDAGAWSSVWIDLPILDQVFMGIQELSNCIYYWLQIFDKIRFYGIRGNHGRTAKSGLEKDYNNWDVIVYRFLETEFRNNPRVEFVIPKTWWHMERIRNHNFLMMHGDDVKGKNPPFKGFADAAENLRSHTKQQPDYILGGHFHVASEFLTRVGRVLTNGSFVGNDVYSLKNNFPLTKPEQKLFGIHDEKGKTFSYDINLDNDIN